MSERSGMGDYSYDDDTLTSLLLLPFGLPWFAAYFFSF